MNFTHLFLFKHYLISTNIHNKLHDAIYSTTLYNLQDTVLSLSTIGNAYSFTLNVKTEEKRDLQKNGCQDGKLETNLSLYSYFATPNKSKLEGLVLLDI